MANTQYLMVLCALLFCVNYCMAEADPDLIHRHLIYPHQPYFTPIVGSSNGPASRFYRPSPFVSYSPVPEVDEDYESVAMVAKMSRLLDTALVQLKEEVGDLKQQLKSETERSRRLEQQVDQLKQSVTKQEEFGEEDNVSPYARFNGALSTALGIGRPWVRTFFSFRKSSSFASTGTPITYDIIDANVGSTVSAGVFTAPRAGYYYFSFNGVTDATNNTVNAALVKNGNKLTTAYGTAASYSPLSIQELLVLSAGDTVSIQLQIPSGQTAATTGTLYEDGSSYFTRFNGFSVALL